MWKVIAWNWQKYYFLLQIESLGVSKADICLLRVFDVDQFPCMLMSRADLVKFIVFIFANYSRYASLEKIWRNCHIISISCIQRKAITVSIFIWNLGLAFFHAESGSLRFPFDCYMREVSLVLCVVQCYRYVVDWQPCFVTGDHITFAISEFFP